MGIVVEHVLWSQSICIGLVVVARVLMHLKVALASLMQQWQDILLVLILEGIIVGFVWSKVRRRWRGRLPAESRGKVIHACGLREVDFVVLKHIKSLPLRCTLVMPIVITWIATVFLILGAVRELHHRAHELSVAMRCIDVQVYQGKPSAPRPWALSLDLDVFLIIRIRAGYSPLSFERALWREDELSGFNLL